MRFPIAGRSRPGYASGMADVTQILSSIEAGDPNAAEELLPLVYDELRKLAGARLAAEAPGQTLQPTALVHEAYLRLVGEAEEQHWDSRGTSSRPPPRPCDASWSKSVSGSTLRSVCNASIVASANAYPASICS